MDDTRIVDLFLDRNEDAITESRCKYGARLQGLANRILRDGSDAEEAMNDTYLSAWNAIPPSEPRDYLFAFLARITRCRALNRWRQRRRQDNGTTVVELSGELEECLASPDDTECGVADAELGREIDAFLNTLLPRNRKIFMQRYWYALSLSAIARETGSTESAVKSSLFHTRQKMKAYLREKGVGV